MTPSNLTLPRAAAVYKRLDPEPRADRVGPRGHLAVRVMGSEDWRRSRLAPTTHSRPRPGGCRRCRADPFRNGRRTRLLGFPAHRRGPATLQFSQIGATRH